MIEAREILEILPHRYPFLMVDRIIEIVDDKKAVGIKNVTINEPFFQGHYPGRPTMPGAMIAEAMAQVGGIMLLASRRHDKLVPYLAGISNLRFKKPVYPGDTLHITVEMLGGKGTIGKVKGQVKVGDDIIAYGEMMFALVPEEKVK